MYEGEYQIMTKSNRETSLTPDKNATLARASLSPDQIRANDNIKEDRRGRRALIPQKEGNKRETSTWSSER